MSDLRMRRSSIVLLAITLGCLVAVACLTTVAIAEEPADPEVCVGAYYFHGWSGKTESFHLPELLQKDFGHRRPVWGWRVNTVEDVSHEIDLCADHGLKFWSFCWYYPERPDKNSPLNEALELYLKAPNCERMKFCLLVANHGGYRIGPKDWDSCCATWIELFKGPTHLTVDGKPLIIFFSPGELGKAFGGADKVREALDQLRTKAKATGLSGVTVAACSGPGNFTWLQQCGYDVVTAYNYSFAWMDGSGEKPFGELVDKTEKVWEAYAAKSPLPYVPVATIGWDRRPWEVGKHPAEKISGWYTGRTPEKVEDFVHRGVEWLQRHPDKATKERLLLLYAWNEIGEGGYLTPTVSEGTSYLEAVGKALGQTARKKGTE